MNAGGLMLGAAVVACASSFAVVKLVEPAASSAPAPAGAIDANAVTEISAGQRELRDMLRGLTDRIGKLESRRAPVGSGPTEEEVLIAVREVLAASGADMTRLADAVGEEALPIDYETAMAQIGDPSLDWDDKQAVWAKINAAGLTDKVIAAIEAHAKANPNDAEAQTGMGAAYLQKIWTVKNDVEKGTWAMKADRAFDDALDIDPNRWDSRFLKATSLSFWPPVMGKQSEAISNFETLVSQQEASGTKQSGYDQTYLYLGNLYDQQGNKEKARATWQRGLNQFPDNAELRKKIGK